MSPNVRRICASRDSCGLKFSLPEINFCETNFLMRKINKGVLTQLWTVFLVANLHYPFCI